MKKKIKTIALGLVGVIAVIVIVFAVRESNTLLNTGKLVPLTPPLLTTCYDTDGGSNLFVQGATRSLIDPGYTGVMNDSCDNAGRLIEYSCRPDGKIAKTPITCPAWAVCRDGRCAAPLTR